MNAQILIKTANDWFEFSKSKTGQLDFVGKWEKNNFPKCNKVRRAEKLCPNFESLYEIILRLLFKDLQKIRCFSKINV
jgi:hypothetical protein